MAINLLNYIHILKKISFSFLFIAAIFAIIFTNSGCKNGKNNAATATIDAGVVTFSIEAPQQSKEMGMMAGMLPKEATLYFDHDKAAIEVSMMGMMTMRMITDGNARTQTMLVSAMGGKQATIASETDLKPKLDSLNTTLEETTETKEILGIKTTKFILRDTLKNITSSIYVAKDAPLGNIYWSLPFKNLKGLVLQYEAEIEGNKLLLTAKKIEAKTPENKEFIIPEGYTKVDFKNFGK